MDLLTLASVDRRRHTPAEADRIIRDLGIARAHQAGISIRALAVMTRLSPARIHRILEDVGQGHEDPSCYAAAADSDHPHEILIRPGVTVTALRPRKK